MNFHFNEEEQEILDMLHDYAVKEVAPRAHEIDEEEKFPMEARNGLAEMGMMGMYFPEEATFLTSQFARNWLFIVLQHLLYYPLMSLFAAGLFTNTVQKNRNRNTLQLLLQVRS